jgi:hypothetical protein
LLVDQGNGGVLLVDQGSGEVVEVEAEVEAEFGVL